MKKYFFVPLMFFVLSISSADDKPFVKQSWIREGMIGVAHFKIFRDAKNGAIGDDFHQIPAFMLEPNILTTPTDDSEALCVVNDKGQAIDEKGSLLGMCEKPEAVSIRTLDYVLRDNDNQ